MVLSKEEVFRPSTAVRRFDKRFSFATQQNFAAIALLAASTHDFGVVFQRPWTTIHTVIVEVLNSSAGRKLVGTEELSLIATQPVSNSGFRAASHPSRGECRRQVPGSADQNPLVAADHFSVWSFWLILSCGLVERLSFVAYYSTVWLMGMLCERDFPHVPLCHVRFPTLSTLFSRL